MNAELLITEHKKEEGTAKYAKYAKNPNPSPQSGFGFAYFAYFAVQEIAWAGIMVAPWRLGACVKSSFLSVKSVKSVVPFFWLRLAAPSLRACVESSSPVKPPGQTWSNHFPCLDHARQINGSACPSTTYTQSHEGSDRIQSNPVKPVKPSQTNGVLEYWSKGGVLAANASSPLRLRLHRPFTVSLQKPQN
jgi:hypothetical protein